MDKPLYPIRKSEDDWKDQLGPESYRILRQKGTEFPHTGKYNLHFDNGEYSCLGCGQLLFKSQSKFESGCGWPSFDQAVDGAIEYLKDVSHGMQRVEIVCSQCGGHLGHVFNDGPTSSGLRYCVNSASIDFTKS
ncbi:peptide-methionine (R)-S-oxide reductase MsrB [Imtechella halotolerans]|uniref:peptide-methionine (R)-S-oxide reductase n=1 Tax=Imtechella halotolerans K1 TaxID=946077 RepID=I0WE63_9FLAO|nr:peptide-methionine (R)-S-oxide reductase MsrB [Imtechella halotolerans]EID74679.1 peptide methionine sulfoxide reductase [Imtechella halotolerans K1]WMQ64200.1 peptide-methionine (R)-S-oxide reductase MsrB [Imtechella halotolerans]